MEVVIHAVVLAFGLILPLGVQNVFIFNQGMRQRRYIHALPAVITAGVSDTLLIGAAVGGVSLILLQWPVLANVMYAVGSLFLLYMAWSIWRSSKICGRFPDGNVSGATDCVCSIGIFTQSPCSAGHGCRSWHQFTSV